MLSKKTNVVTLAINRGSISMYAHHRNVCADIACKEVTKNIREKWRTLVRILPEDIMVQHS